eukprot:scaffold1803_cov195-Alexandrium_tamarense.AAC.31
MSWIRCKYLSQRLCNRFVQSNIRGGFIADLEDDFMDDFDDDNAPAATATNTELSSSQVSLETSPEESRPLITHDVVAQSFQNQTNVLRSGGNDNSLSLPFPSASTSRDLTDWIRFHKEEGHSSLNTFSDKKRYFERSVHLLHSLVLKIVGGKRSEGVGIDPIYIKTDNVMVLNSMGDKEVAYFIRNGQTSGFGFELSVYGSTEKYAAMNAFGKIAYAILMRGERPLSSRGDTGSTAISTASRIQDSINEANGRERGVASETEPIKVRRTSTEGKSANFTSGMIDAGVPYPLCRFVADLMGGDGDDGGIFRSDDSFHSFSDVISDLEQMIELPDAFLHASATDRWRLAFGEKMYGREEETKVLLDVAGQIRSSHNDSLFGALSAFLTAKKRPMVMVSGHSGSGKSRLVREIRAPLEKQGWIFLRCKFDRVVHAEPLSILAHAFEEYVENNCSTSGDDEKDFRNQKICERLDNMTPEGLTILYKHIPSLKKHVKNKSDINDTNKDTLPSSKVSKERMHCLFGQLLGAISGGDQAVLFFLDDLQWADSTSLELIASLIKGDSLDFSNISPASDRGGQRTGRAEKCNVLFVGSYRNNEVDDEQLFKKVLSQIQADDSIEATSISISGFNIDTLNEMISDSLCLPRRRTRQLSEIVMQKTDGLVLHVIEFLGRLTTDNLLTHNFVRGWEYDSDLIDVCPITESVAELFTAKLRRLSEEVMLGLQICSCFGSQVERRVIDFVKDYDGESSVDINAAIDVAVSEGLVERTGQIFLFAHDMIQQAAFDSVKEDDLAPLLRKLAASLIKNSSAVKQTESILFIAVDLINRIGSEAIKSAKERLLYARLNSRAGKKALSAPDFASAVMYAESGISFLDGDHWESQYGLSLSLYETSVAAHYSMPDGDKDMLNERINAVFDRAKCFSDKFNAHFIRIKVLSMSECPQDAINESLLILQHLGEPFDPSEIDVEIVERELKKHRDRFSGENKRHFLSSTPMSDLNKRRAMQIMHSLSTNYHRLKTLVGAYVACRMIDLSINFGHCDESVIGVSTFASYLVTFLRDVDEAYSWGRLALDFLAKSPDANSMIPAVYTALHCNVQLWKEPLQSTIDPLLRGYRLAYCSGDIINAVWNSFFYIRAMIFSGEAIDVTIKEVEGFASIFAPHKQLVFTQSILTPVYNMLRHLKGFDEQPLFPLSKVISSEVLLHDAFEAKLYSIAHSLIQLAESYRTEKETEKAAECYEASIRSAREHRFIHEEAIACELAGYFFEDQGDKVKSRDMFQQAHNTYTKWGAVSKANSIPLNQGVAEGGDVDDDEDTNKC